MPHEAGQVLLVGAGPGPVDLMTVRALRAVENAQALLYDALVADEVLALAPSRCLRIRTGKRAGKASMSQDEINRLMLRLARRGLRVVRLKGGDPSIFGRVGEEQAFLAAHGVGSEVVPGVTAASAAAAQFGFPLTHRGEARRLIIDTARTEGGAVREAPADPSATHALYMARDSAAPLAARMIADGLPASTPALAVERAGAPDARLLTSTLGNLAADLEAWAGEGPVLLVIGQVAAMAQVAADPALIARAG